MRDEVFGCCHDMFCPLLFSMFASACDGPKSQKSKEGAAPSSWMGCGRDPLISRLPHTRDIGCTLACRSGVHAKLS